MDENYLGAKLLVEKTHSHNEFVDIFGKLTVGGITVGMKCNLGPLTLEIVNLFINANDNDNLIVTVKGCVVDDVTPNQVLTFASSFVK